MRWISRDFQQYKANFHTHTTESDGKRTPQESVDCYFERGYDILAITDHRKLTDTSSLDVHGMIMVPGVEFDTKPDALQAAHILGLGITEKAISAYGGARTPAQEIIDLIRADGGLAVYAHPAWSLNTPEFLLSLHNLSAVEVWNSVSDLPYNVTRSDSSLLLDICGARGMLLPFLGNDDTHHYESDLASGCTMVLAREKTVEGVMDAIIHRRVYATRGPRIYALEMEGNTVHVECSKASTIVFASAALWGDTRVRIGNNLTEAEYTIHDREWERFIRVEIIDENGRKAYSSPFSLLDT